MTKDRYTALMRGDESLTDAEMSQGWHFCWDWDGLLISPDMPEFNACICKVATKEEDGL